MQKTYPILLENVPVGDAQVNRQGLYYFIYCACRLPKKTVYRVRVCCEEKQADLNILVPEADMCSSRTRIAVSKLGSGELRFYVVTKNESANKHLIPIIPDKPFFQMDQLEEMCLHKQDNMLYAVRNN